MHQLARARAAGSPHADQDGSGEPLARRAFTRRGCATCATPEYVVSDNICERIPLSEEPARPSANGVWDHGLPDRGVVSLTDARNAVAHKAHKLERYVFDIWEYTCVRRGYRRKCEICAG